MPNVTSFRDFAEQVRATADIAEVVGQYVELKRAGANLKACCPFHQEKTPSFNVHPGKQIFKCFGCGKAGDVITFVREIERVEFREALEILAQKYGLEVPRFQAQNRDEEEVRWRQTLGEVLEHAARYYQQKLAHPDQGAFARRYLTERGVSGEMVQVFGLGLATEDWEGLARHLRAKGYSNRALVEAGVAHEKKAGEGVYDYLRERLVFPIVNARGHVIAFGGRIFEGDGPKYLNTPETAFFHKGKELYGLFQAREAMTRANRPAVLVEGYMDVIACHQAGEKSAVASMGTSLTPDQARLIRRHSAEAVFLYDADEAGIKAILRGIEVLVGANLQVRVGNMPEGEDPDSVVRKNGPEALRRVIEEAVPFFDFLIAYAKTRFDLSVPEERVRAVELFESALFAIAEPMVFEGYVTKLAVELGHDERMLRSYLQKRGKRFSRRETVSAGAFPHRRQADAEEASCGAGILPADYGATPDGAPEEAALLGAGPPPRAEMGLFRILMDHADARVAARKRLRTEWIAHPLVRYWAQVLLDLEDTVSDAWPALMLRCQDAAQKSFLESAIFHEAEPLDENYLAVMEHLLSRLESDYWRAENSRLNLLVNELYRDGNREGLSKIVDAQYHNLRLRLQGRHRATKENPCARVKHG